MVGFACKVYPRLRLAFAALAEAGGVLIDSV